MYMTMLSLFETDFGGLIYKIVSSDWRCEMPLLESCLQSVNEV